MSRFLYSGVAIVVVALVFLVLERQPACNEDSVPKIADLTLDIAVHKAAIERLTTTKAELEAEVARRREHQKAAAGGAGESSDKARVRELEQRLKALEQQLQDKPHRSAGGRSLKQLVTADHPPAVPASVPRLPTKDEVLARVTATPECLHAVEKAFTKNNLNSQFSQDWFVYMNYFHHLSTGFYVDIGASSWKDISNTWFFDACLGWKGICVEADPTLAAALRAHRTCTVVNACVAEKNGTMALLAAGIQIGHVVPVAKKGDKGVVVPCHTMREILDANEVTHIDLLNLDIEDSEAGALATFPENDEVTVDVILIENEKGDVTRPPCFRGNVLRFPFFNRQYGLVNLLGDDIWVKLTKPSLWRVQMAYPRLNAEREKNMRKKYAQNPDYTPEMVEKLLYAPDTVHDAE